MLLFGIGLAGLQAQTAIPATGGVADGSGGSASYTVGQVIYTTATGTDGTVSQGVQQPFEISVVSGVEQNGIDLQCVVYPNPVTDYLILNIDDNIFKTGVLTTLQYQLFNIKGEMITTGEVTTTKTKIITSNLTSGNYLLRIINEKRAIKTFKIIKY